MRFLNKISLKLVKNILFKVRKLRPPSIKPILNKWKVLLPVFLGIVLISGYLVYLNQSTILGFITRTPSISASDKNRAFISEIYDKIMENYWESITDQKLSELFGLGIEKLAGPQMSTLDQSKKGATSLSDASKNPLTGKPANKEEVLKTIDSVTSSYDKEKKKEFIVNLASVVLANLQPFGRSGLYTQKLETQLKNTVNNINPEKDLYKDLGLPKNASQAAVEQAFNNLPEEKKKNKEIAYAKDTLTNKDTKMRYDQTQVEPTIFTKLITSDIAYLQFKKFSPTSLDEFQKALNSFDKPNGPTALIFDLRGNIGGAIDSTTYFLGNFLGINQYAYDFYHQGNYQPFKTNLDQLPVMKQFRIIIVLVDNQTQSSAEMMAGSLKKYHMGIIVGVPTKGWGTVERVFPLEHQIDSSEKYSVFLVHSLTLRDDNQPIEGRGIDPNVNIKDSDWENQLKSFVRYPELVIAVKGILSQLQ